ncbi:hypothetical protein [Methylobacterium durans]|uniref:Uncharacterized protein n=1 Tax=Methylobacterium durans TaxID=2202825 RepID=A0A2U8W275_9HYPH|nr:hypothetical protein [Methylobacterium durans]AWN40179.1 hypothetical protein DK389_06040 [Methylobacterium durans]
MATARIMTTAGVMAMTGIMTMTAIMTTAGVVTTAGAMTMIGITATARAISTTNGQQVGRKRWRSMRTTSTTVGAKAA